MLKHEERDTSLLNSLVDIPVYVRDHVGTCFLKRYVNEQVEEESTGGVLLERIKRIAEKSAGMFALDLGMPRRFFYPTVSRIN